MNYLWQGIVFILDSQQGRMGQFPPFRSEVRNNGYGYSGMPSFDCSDHRSG
jgi:hypothetical protein